MTPRNLPEVAPAGRRPNTLHVVTRSPSHRRKNPPESLLPCPCHTRSRASGEGTPFVPSRAPNNHRDGFRSPSPLSSSHMEPQSRGPANGCPTALQGTREKIPPTCGTLPVTGFDLGPAGFPARGSGHHSGGP